jgi:hypothetical protein
VRKVVQDQKHRSLLLFVRKIVEVPLAYSKDDLSAFRSVASREYPVLVHLIDEYIRLAERSDTDVIAAIGANSKRPKRSSAGAVQMHLFDLLRDKKLFPSNSDLSGFAARIIPGMTTLTRWEKMSRGEIVVKIIEYVETRDLKTRRALEASMRDALISSPDKPSDRRSFFSKWEQIIKGTHL